MTFKGGFILPFEEIHVDTDKMKRYICGLSFKVRSWRNPDLLLSGPLSELTRNGNLVC